MEVLNRQKVGVAESDSKDSAKSSEEQSDNGESSAKEVITEKTGFEPSELLKAPVKSPELKKARKPTEQQSVGFGVGVLVIIIGAILWAAVGFWPGIVVGLIGVLVAAVSIMVRF